MSSVLIASGKATETGPEPEKLATNPTESINLRDQLLFGPIGRETYIRFAPKDNPNYAIEMIERSFANENGASVKSLQERQKLWENYEILKDFLTNLKVDDNNRSCLVSHTYAKIREISPLADKELGSERSGLGLHLQQASDLCKNLLFNQDGSTILNFSTTEAELITYVMAPLHDCAKYLGSINAQVIPDHEIIIGTLAKECFLGKNIDLGGRFSNLTQRDIDFISSVMSDHENIFKEKDRFNWIGNKESSKKAKAFFALVDTLAGSIVPDLENNQHWRLSEKEFNQRFVSLVRRHLDANSQDLKVFRPEWVKHAVIDIGATLDSLERFGCIVRGIEPGTKAKDSLYNTAISVISDVLEKDSKLLSNTTKTNLGLTDWQVQQLIILKADLMGR